MSKKQNGQKAGTPSPERLGSQKDELYDTAKTLVIEKQRAGLHLLQAHLKIGFMRAALLLDELERNGVIGPFNGNEPRKVLIANNVFGDNTKFRDAGGQSTALRTDDQPHSL